MNRNLTFALIAASVIAGPVAAQDPTGTWRTEATERGYLEIQVSPCGAAMCGTIVRAISTAGETGTYPHIGRQMIWDMQPDGAGKWSGGKIWDPRNDKVYNSKMELGGSSLRVSGCVFGVCQGQSWQRVN